MAKQDPKNLMSTHLRLRPDASIEQLPVDAGFWGRIAEGALGSFHNEYLVSCHSFGGDWQTWEMHPMGDEIVCLLSGSVVFELSCRAAHGIPPGRPDRRRCCSSPPARAPGIVPRKVKRGVGIDGGVGGGRGTRRLS